LGELTANHARFDLNRDFVIAIAGMKTRLGVISPVHEDDDAEETGLLSACLRSDDLHNYRFFMVLLTTALILR